MKIRAIAYILILLTLVLVACGPAATMAAPATQAPAFIAAAATAAPVVHQPANNPAAGAPAAAGESAPQPVVYGVGAGINVSDIQTSTRMIIKNAEIKLQVADTDVAIDGVTQIAGDLGGYIISSRVWYQDTNIKSLKYATVTIGVPVEQFETIMRRLRGLAIKVLDETASGEDVTDQYVDLQSQLQNLEATRDRIRSFLQNAKTVDEALKVNQELSKIEGQIEEIQGRINYLQNRSAYSTITITLEPQPPVLTPTPTATPTATPTPTPTPTPIPWKPGETFDQAGHTLTSAYKGVINMLIWVFVFIVPLFIPPVLVGWGIWYLVKRKTKKQ